jgi:glycosyltransferase involved in cell wall biosynthesis
VHIGLMTRGDVAYALDLANEMIGLPGTSVTLYMCSAHVERYVGAQDRSVDRLYELGLLDPRCNVHLVKLARMRDPRSLFVYYRLARRMCTDGVDVVHVLVGPEEPWLGVLICLLRDLPVVSTMIVPVPNVGGAIPDFVTRVTYRLVAWGSDMVVVNGSAHVGLVRELYGVPEGHVTHVPLNVMARPCRVDEDSRAKSSGVVLFFGAARRHKGLEFLIRAQPEIVRHVPGAHIRILAHGEELERCRALIQDPTRCQIDEGYVSYHEMALAFEGAAVVVLPYLSAATSGVLMTALSYCKPVVATRVGCLPEYIEDGVTGLLVNPGNVEELAEAIVRLLSDEQLRRRMSAEIRRWLPQKQMGVSERMLETYQRAMLVDRHPSRDGGILSGRGES